MPFVVALALDGDPLSGREFRDQVDADVTPVESCECFAIGPVGPAPDFCDRESGVLPCDAHEQLFEPPAFLRMVSAFVADSAEDLPAGRNSSEGQIDLGCWHARGVLWFERWECAVALCAAVELPQKGPVVRGGVGAAACDSVYGARRNAVFGGSNAAVWRRRCMRRRAGSALGDGPLSRSADPSCGGVMREGEIRPGGPSFGNARVSLRR